MNITEKLTDDLEAAVKRLRKLPPDEAFTVGSDMHEAIIEASREIGKARRTAVRQLRAEGFTLQAIGDMTGVTANRVYQIENGKTKG